VVHNTSAGAACNSIAVALFEPELTMPLRLRQNLITRLRVCIWRAFCGLSRRFEEDDAPSISPATQMARACFQLRNQRNRRHRQADRALAQAATDDQIMNRIHMRTEVWAANHPERKRA
jgi:hypothetical protein